MIPYFDVRYNYVEPFFGGGAVFCYLMDNYKFLKVKINDTNKELMGIYRSIRDNPTDFIKEAQRYQNEFLVLSGWPRKLMFQELKRQYWANQSSPLLYFLMLISFNGIWATSRASNGLFSGSFGNPRLEIKNFVDAENLYQWAKALERVEITTVDFEELIIPKNSLVYCDPPYINSNVSYGSVFSLEDQKRCFRWARKISQEGSYVLLSNKTDGVFFEKMVQGDKEFIKYLDCWHSSNRGLRKATELLILFYPGE